MYYPQSSIDGKIEQLLVLYKHRKVQQELLKELICKMNAHTKFILFANSAQEGELAYEFLLEFLSPEEIQVGGSFQKDSTRVLIENPIEEDVFYEFTIWVRDPIIPLDPDAEGQKKIINSAFGDRGFGDDDWAKALLDKNHIQDFHFDNYFFIEGGNILVNDDFVLIGQNQMQKVAKKLQGARILTVPPNTYLQKYFSPPERPPKKIISVGILDQDIPQDQLPETEKSQKSIFKPRSLFGGLLPKRNFVMPENHIDLFLSMAGKAKNGKHILFLAKAIALDESVNEIVKDANDMLNRLETKLFDELEGDIEIIRNPMPIVPEIDDIFYPCTYNNCLVEIYRDQKTVYLPSFLHLKFPERYGAVVMGKIKDYEDQNEKNWETLGFNVVFIKANFHFFMNNGGALHCLTNDLSRIRI